MSYYYLNLFNYKYRLKFQLAMNDVYFLCLRQHVTYKNGGGGGGGGEGGGGGGSGLDYVILLSEVGKKCQKIDYVIFERPLI